MSMETDSPVVYHGTSESRFPPKEMEVWSLYYVWNGEGYSK